MQYHATDETTFIRLNHIKIESTKLKFYNLTDKKNETTYIHFAILYSLRAVTMYYQYLFDLFVELKLYHRTLQHIFKEKQNCNLVHNPHTTTKTKGH